MVLWILSTQPQNIIPYIRTAKEYFIKRFSSYKDVSKINRTCYYARYEYTMIFQNSHVFGRQIQSILVALCDQFRPCGGWHGFSDWVNNFVQNVAASHDGLKNKILV